MSIREFLPGDLPAILSIYSLSKLDELAYESCAPVLIPLEQDEPRYALFKFSTAYVYDSATLLGYGARKGPEITGLFVHPSGRGKGVGRALLEHLLANYSGPSYLHVAASNRAAISLYQQYGFEVYETYVTSYNGQSVQAATLRQPLGVRSGLHGCGA